MKEYKSTWWEEENSSFEDEMKLWPGWDIFQMFLVYPGKRESYRIILQRERSKEENEA